MNENMLNNSMKYNKEILSGWIKETFKLQRNETITLKEYSKDKGGNTFIYTEITINKLTKFVIKKSVSEITEKDIKRLRTYAKMEKLKKLPIIGHMFRFLGLWFAFTGLYAMFSVCPFCGQAGCPVGVGGAGIIGGIFAILVQQWKSVLKLLSGKLFKKQIS